MSDYLATTATIAVIYAIASVGSAFVISFAGHITIAQGVMFGVGAYSYAILTSNSVDPILALLIAPVIAALVSGGAMLFMNQMEQHVFLLATLALQFVGYEAFRRWDSLTGGNGGMAGVPRPAHLNDQQLFWLCGAVLLVVTLLSWRLLRGVWGLRLRAIRDDSTAAAAFGCPVNKDLRLGLVAAGALAGAAGALSAGQISFIVPASFSIDLSLLVAVMAIMGGANVWAVCLAAFGLVALPEVIYHFFELSSSATGPVQQMVYGAALVLVMVLRPSGLGPETRSRMPLGDASAESRPRPWKQT